MSLVILIPCLGRPQNVKPVVDSIRLATGAHRILFLCSPGDTEQISAVKKSGADHIVVPWQSDKADFALKINHAYEHHTDEDWIFQAADDLTFRVGWDRHAINAAERYRVGVVGTNDLGNPLVKRGKHSTHTLFSRAYIEEYGGTFDGSGVVFCELYDHQWTDNEFVETAMQRGQFVSCPRAVVEHMHPHWGKGQMDDTYLKALRATREDRALFGQRMKKIGIDLRRREITERRRTQQEARVARRQARMARGQ